MSYSQGSGLPAEYASKASHQYLVRDERIQHLLQDCWRPTEGAAVDGSVKRLAQDIKIAEEDFDVIKNFVAVDGGYTEVVHNKHFPSSTIAFLQIGALGFKSDDLHAVQEGPFIDPQLFRRLQELERLKLAIPTRNLRKNASSCMAETVRDVIQHFLVNEQIGGDSLASTLHWLIFHEFLQGAEQAEHEVYAVRGFPSRLGHEPGMVSFNKNTRTSDYGYVGISESGERVPVKLVDVFRFHEIVSTDPADTSGASGILAYLINTLEQLVIAHCFRFFLKTKPEALKATLFIKDGGLGFFGQTARLHKPYHALINFLNTNHGVFLAGFEKSGEFVEHAKQIQPILQPGQVLLPDDSYIYQHIVSGVESPDRTYGHTTNYGHKVIYKSPDSQIFVVSIPAMAVKKNPAISDLIGLKTVLAAIPRLKSNMHENALFPVVLVNNLVSLSGHPSNQILQRFVHGSIPK
jgi:hypothetical protein